MWLINTSNLQLEKFQECPAKSYAILSHTWGTDVEELDFDEFNAGQGRGKVGFEKVRLCCEEAKKNNIQYAWVDTCCIDKRSSTGLSKAINSMFAWYAKSKTCYVYLADVSLRGSADELTSTSCEGTLQKSRWFTRGWTLQELIAPETLLFFTKEWAKIGDKVNLAADIHAITGIDVDVLKLRTSFLSRSIAQRMSWASLRQTTRLEDNAYCLLGLFDVNLPLMYGEGEKAFLRLQKQIIEQTDDETIFALDNVPFEGSGLLAPNAAHFANATQIESHRAAGNYNDRPPYFSTNKGLSFECQLIPYAMNTYLVPLNCHLAQQRLSIFLTKTLDSDQYLRASYEGESVSLNNSDFMDVSLGKMIRQYTRNIFVADNGHGLQLAPHGGAPLLRIRSCLPPSISRLLNELDDFQSQHGGHEHPAIAGAGSAFPISPGARLIQLGRKELFQGVVIKYEPSTLGLLLLTHPCLHLGFDEDFKPTCFLYMHTVLSQFDFSSGSALANYGSILNERPMRPHASAKGDRIRYDDPRGISLKLPISFCTYVEVNFKPTGGLAFDLTISENRPHRLSTSDFCLQCLRIKSADIIVRLTRSAHLVLHKDTFIACYLFVQILPLLYPVFRWFQVYWMLATTSFRWVAWICLKLLE